VLKPDSRFAIFDAMRTGEGELRFPPPLGGDAGDEFRRQPGRVRHALDAAGFEVIKERNRREFAREAFREVQARAAASAGPPPFGMHILMKTDVAQKLAK